MLFKLLGKDLHPQQVHIPQVTCARNDNLPMLEARGAPLPSGIRLLADHSPFGVYDSRVLAAGEIFRVTLLREPVERLASFLGFGIALNLFPDSLLGDRPDIASISEENFATLCRFFADQTGYLAWFDAGERDPNRAMENLLRYDVVARHDELDRFCRLFNRRNPFGAAFREGDILHANRSPRVFHLTSSQAEIARQELRAEYTIWEAPEVQAAMGRP
ncbi:MAG: hypothetical protein LJE84_10415 [Gammaproteobacteria bacterium]|nr:hypothetical protein [Gammaproteobacteria bacterium]